MTALDGIIAELDKRLAEHDATLRGHVGYRRQPSHTVYVPADLFRPTTVDEWGAAAVELVAGHGPLPFTREVNESVWEKLEREPIEDLRVDFEDGYGHRGDEEEDRHAAAAGTAFRDARPSFYGLRCKSLEARSRARAVRTLDVFLEALGVPPAGLVVTLPKVTGVVQVEAMVMLCEHFESAYGLDAGSLRFEAQIETPQAILGPDGTATVARLIGAARGRLVGLPYGTYDYSAACGISAPYQSLEHPAADHAKAVMQVAAAGTGVRVCDGSTNILPVGGHDAIVDAWALHARLVRRSLERGFYQGWDLHFGQLPTRFGAVHTFYRDGEAAATDRLGAYLQRRASGVLDEPATARALAGYLLRGADCGAIAPAFDRALLESL